MTRPTPPQSAEPWVDPAEDAASMAGLELAPAVEAAARLVREAHMAKRQAESESAVATKVAKWRRDGYRPQGARHKK